MVEQVEPVVADLGLRASGRRLDLGGDVRPRQAEWIDVAGRPRLVVDGSDDITRLWDPLSPDPPVRNIFSLAGFGGFLSSRRMLAEVEVMTSPSSHGSAGRSRRAGSG